MGCGIKNNLKASPETKKSLFDVKKSDLPKNMDEAISLFESNDELNQIFTSKFIKTMVTIDISSLEKMLKKAERYKKYKMFKIKLTGKNEDFNKLNKIREIYPKKKYNRGCK